MTAAWIFLFFLISLFVTKDIFVLKKNPKTPFSPSISAPIGLETYVINLDRSPHRLQYVWPLITQLPYTAHRISAIDGAENPAFLISQVNEKLYQRYSGGILPGPGTVACALSHIKAWKTFLASPASHALFCEDDISFDPGALSTSIEDILRISGWDICMFDISHRGGPLPVYPLKNQQSLCVYTFNIAHAGAYILTRRAAQNLLEKALPLIMPIDHLLTRSWETSLTLVGVEPRLVHQTYGDSDIDSVYREKKPYRRTTLQAVRRGVFVIKSSLMRCIWNLFQYTAFLLKRFKGS